jgi:hypothetical protein
MRIESNTAMPVKLAPSAQSLKEQEVNSANSDGTKTESSDEAKSKENDSVHISMEGRKKLQEQSEDPKDKLPPHIKQMIEAIERLIEMIEAAEEALAKAKEVDYPDDEGKRDALEMHQNQVNSLEFARSDAVKGLMEAMKEAGISEPGIIAGLMR